jgi:integrase
VGIYKRTPGGPWWVRFTVRGKTIRKSAETHIRERAEEFETALRDRYWRQTKLGETVHTWKQAVERLRREAQWRESTRKRNEIAFGFFQRLDSTPIAAINADVTRAARTFVEHSQGAASANRIMAVMRGVLRACVRWQWITHAPPVPMAHVPQSEIAPLDAEQCQRLLAELPEHLKAPMLFSVLTGIRSGNVRDLDWSQVDLEEGHVTIPASQYKTKRDVRFPLSTNAVAVLSGLPNRSGRVFLYDGKPIAGSLGKKAFRKACARAGLDGLRWHDLRHTFASWVAQSGASDRVLQSLGGWTSPRMVARYAHLKPSDLRPHVEFAGTFAVTGNKASPTKRTKKAVKLVPGRGIEPPTHALRMLGATKRRYTKR